MPSAVTMISPHQKIIHSSIYSTCIHSIISSVASSRRESTQVTHHPVKVAVVGSGQSAAEIVIDLRSRLQAMIPLLPDADGNSSRHEIDLIIKRGSLKPSDDTPFSNEIFDPACAYANIHSSQKLAVEFFLSRESVFQSEERGGEAHGAQGISGDQLRRGQPRHY